MAEQSIGGRKKGGGGKMTGNCREQKRKAWKHHNYYIDPQESIKWVSNKEVVNRV